MALVALAFAAAGCASSSNPTPTEQQDGAPGVSIECQSVRDAIGREKLARNDADARGDSAEAGKQRQAIELDKQVAASLGGCDVSDLTG